MRYFHVNYISRARWFAPILIALSNINRVPDPNWPSEYALGVATKFEILNYLLSRRSSDLAEIHSELRAAKDIDRCIAKRGETAKAFPLDQDLAVRTVAHLECFISEAFATWDLAMAFAVRLCRGVLGKRVTESSILGELKSRDIDFPWLQMRKKLRNFQLHNGSIWIAIEVVRDTPRRYELIVLLRNTKDLRKQADWTAWQELKGLVPGLNGSLRELQAWLVQEIDRSR